MKWKSNSGTLGGQQTRITRKKLAEVQRFVRMSNAQDASEMAKTCRTRESDYPLGGTSLT